MSNPFVPIKKADLVLNEDLPFSIQYNDIYHSKEGGLEQSHHVFIEGNQLIQRWINLLDDDKSHFTIAETGFGIGLNFMLAWNLWERYAPSSASLHFISCEKHPIDKKDLKQCLLRWPELKDQLNEFIELYPVLTPGYHHLSFSSGRVSLTLMIGDALESYEQLLVCGDPNLEHRLRTSFVDAWFLDGFAPKCNPAMWSDALIQVMAMLSKEGTSLATYTAAQTVKSALCSKGFIVEKRKGFGPKRHMLVAKFSTYKDSPVKKRHTPWHVPTPVRFKNKKAVVIGAGLAGCFIAHSLAMRGWNVILVEQEDDIAQGASANQQAVLFPKLSAYRSPLTQLMLSSFLYAYQFYKTLLNQNDFGVLQGSLLLAYNNKEHKAQFSLASWLEAYPELGSIVDEAEASKVSGISLKQGGLYIPMSGWINTPKLCRLLIDNPNISLLTNTHVSQLVYEKGNWIIDDLVAEVVIIANGKDTGSFAQTSYLPIKYIRGQMTEIAATVESAALKVPLCGQGHVLPAVNDFHLLGASYDLGVSENFISENDDCDNLDKLNQISPNIKWSNEVTNHWVGVRASTPDYIPLVGQVAEANDFLNTFAGLETNSKRWIPKVGIFYPGLYVCTAFGSRGITTIPLCTEWLAGTINGEISCLPRSMVQSLSPARFLRRHIIRGEKN